MGLTMKEILKKYSDCDLISLTSGSNGYNVNENDFLKALDKVEDQYKKMIDVNECHVKNGKDPLSQIPIELKDSFLKYEISFFNSVTLTNQLLINYYFKLNEETKGYLLKFRNDFSIDGFSDLTFYKDGNIEFSSCTHEGFNSIEFDYKQMTKEEIINFLNDELYEYKDNKIFEIINKLIDMKNGTKFSFMEFNLVDHKSLELICRICEKLNLILIAAEKKEQPWRKVNLNGEFEAVHELPAGLCDLKDLIEKKR